jgi:Ca2+-binding RTX toxin-like protein
MSVIRTGRLLTAVGGIAVVIAGFGATAASAEPRTQLYPTTSINRDFSTGLGGWTARNQYKGACVQTLTCPPLPSEFASTGGAGGAGDGFLITKVMDLTGLLSEGRVFWESRTFKWRGVDNEPPTAIRFTIDRNTNLQALLALGGSATYRVDVVDTTNGGNVATVIVPKRNLDSTTSWRHEGPFTVARDALKLGHVYFLRITSVYRTNAQVIDNGANAYDNVVLFAKAKAEKAGGGTQGNRRHRRARGASCGNADIVGTSDGEALKGTGKRDVIAGLGGDDRIAGKGGNDVLCGGKGNDIVRGNGGRDKLGGGKGRDRCIGGSGRDHAADSCNKTRGVP